MVRPTGEQRPPELEAAVRSGLEAADANKMAANSRNLAATALELARYLDLQASVKRNAAMEFEAVPGLAITSSISKGSHLQVWHSTDTGNPASPDGTWVDLINEQLHLAHGAIFVGTRLDGLGPQDPAQGLMQLVGAFPNGTPVRMILDESHLRAGFGYTEQRDLAALPTYPPLSPED